MLAKLSLSCVAWSASILLGGGLIVGPYTRRGA